MSITVNHLSFRYNPGTPMEQVALNDVNLQINEGEFIGLIGHTGSGKSTLVQQLNGLLKPTGGTVYVDGEDIFGDGYDMYALRSKVGLVFQYPEHQLFEETVFKDVCFGPKNLGLSQEEIELRANEALKLVKLDEEYFCQSPFDLSGGQKRRVAIAGVLAMKPEVLILDEPTAGLDPHGRDGLLDTLMAIKKERNCTIILVSHSMEDVARCADRVVVMDKGSVLFDDVPIKVFKNREKLKEIGLNVPQITETMYALKAAGFNVSTDIITVDAAVKEILNAT